MADALKDRVVVGTSGHVVGLDPNSGRELWRTKLRGRGFVSTRQAGDRVLAATGGHLFALDPVTGAVLWENALKGLGYGMISLGGDASVDAASVEAERRRRAAAS